jgi:imidazolonepropionase-like amidohydrolase
MFVNSQSRATKCRDYSRRDDLWFENGDITVGMGTDAAIPFVPHYEFWRELVYYQHFAEISNKRSIHIATELNAILLDIDEISGTVEVGKFSDFIVLDTNPLDDLMVLKNPRHVVIRGNLIENPGYEKSDRSA